MRHQEADRALSLGNRGEEMGVDPLAIADQIGEFLAHRPQPVEPGLRTKSPRRPPQISSPVTHWLSIPPPKGLAARPGCSRRTEIRATSARVRMRLTGGRKAIRTAGPPRETSRVSPAERKVPPRRKGCLENVVYPAGDRVCFSIQGGPHLELVSKA
jgi:hypothetical protein